MSIFVESKAYRPFTYPWAAEASKRQSQELYWHTGQIQMVDDIAQYHSADGLKTRTVSHDTNKYIIKTLLCMFTELDRTVATGYGNILGFVKNNEIRNVLIEQMAKEVMHQRAYALAAENFGFSDSEWSAFHEYKEMRDKIDAMSETLYEPQDRDEFKFCVGLGQILLGEGQGLYAAFMTLLNYKRSGVIMGFNDVNQWSLTDEQEHVENNIRILAHARQDLTEVENEYLDRILRATARKYKEAELRLIDLIYLHGDMEDLPKQQAYDYMEFLEELRLNELGLRGFVRSNPLEWMDWMLSGARQDNFFEKKVTDYSHTGLPGEVDYTKYLHLVVDTPL